MMSDRNLEIIKAALEGDIIRQKDSPNKDKPDFVEWLKDSEKLLHRVRIELFARKAKAYEGDGDEKSR